MINKKLIFLLLLFCSLKPIKIDRVILSTNNNPDYIQFWPIVAKVWKEIIGIKPTLALIADKSVIIDESIGDVIRFEPLDNVSTAQYAQTIRLLLPAYFPEDVCITSDIDMLPLNKQYFVDLISDIPDDCFLVYKNGYYEYHQYHFKLPICYNVAKGKIFKEIFNINDVSQIQEIVKNWAALNLGWETDELMLYKHLVKWADYNQKCIKLGHFDDKRIDRLAWIYDCELLKQNFYVDAHCPRPYNTYKQLIDNLVNLLYDNKK